MKALDTNALVRFLVADDARQAGQVRRLLEQAERKREVYFVPQPVVLETIWVLSSVYACGRDEILTALEALAAMPVIEFERPDQVHRLVLLGRSEGTDLADLVVGIAARARGCETTLTFDRSAAKSALFELIHV